MLLDASIRTCRQRLQETGQLVAQSGSTLWESGRLAIHSDYGPLGQDKPVNQDYALLWQSSEVEPNHPIRWAAALADGVTCSFRPEWGAQLACFHALVQLIGDTTPQNPLDRAVLAVHAAGEAIGALVEHIVNNSDQFRPEDELPATWRMRLKWGQLLQTTLTLAWLEADTLSVAMIGDGGASLRIDQDGQFGDAILAGGELESDTVHALGPANRRVEGLDCWRQVPFEAGMMLALYTDGIGRFVGSVPGRLLDRIAKRRRESPDANAAEAVVRELADLGEESLEDNLTLLFAHRT